MKPKHYKTIALLLLFFILLSNSQFLNKNFCEKIYVFETPKQNLQKSGPRVLMIAGTHGNEKSGVVGLELLIKRIKENKINFPFRQLIIVPRVNKCGLMVNQREIPYSDPCSDINRCYPTKYGGETKGKIARKILNYVNMSDIVFDFHDGWGFYKEGKGSIGSTITSSGTQFANQISEHIVSNLNQQIKKPEQQFSVLSYDGSLVRPFYIGSLPLYCTTIDKRNYMIIEISGQKNKLPLNARIQQFDTIIKSIISFFKN